MVDDVDTVGECNSLFNDKVSFVLDDSEFGYCLGFFGCGHKAIVAPYIEENLKTDSKSAALTYISGNQPDYTKTEAAIIENILQGVMDSYIARKWLSAGVAQVSLVEDNFVATAEFNISEPKAMWRVFGELRQTL